MSSSTNILAKKSAIEVADENWDYIVKRRNREIKAVRTKFKRLNNVCMGGFELDTITCVSAMSGAGKSTMAKILCDSMLELNKDVKFNLYNFNFEMISHKNAARSIVTMSGMSLYDLYSVNEPLSDIDLKQLKNYYDSLRSRDNVFFIDSTGTPETILNTLDHYYCEECKPHGKTMVYIIDHILLTEGNKDKAKIDELMNGLIKLKKLIQLDGGHSIGIILSQMNRDIKSEARTKYPDMHRVKTSDISDSSQLEFACDYILFVHIPAKLSLPFYTAAKLPTKIKIKVGDKEVIKPMAYLEMVKNRDGIADITIPLLNKLELFDFDEMNKDVFKQMHLEFRETGEIPLYDPNVQQKLFNS